MGRRRAALELLTKARELGDDVAAVALGPGATASADTLGEHGATTVFASDDEVFANHLAQPAVHALAGLVEEHSPDLILFPASYDARDVAGRLHARIGSTLDGERHGRARRGQGPYGDPRWHEGRRRRAEGPDHRSS